MSSQILQPTRALKVMPGGVADIPFPEVMYSGTTTSFIENLITVDGVDFDALGVSAGDIIYMPSANMSMTVISVPSPDTIEVNWYPDANYSFVIYKGGLNRGCILYIGAESNAQFVVGSPSGSRTPITLSASGFLPLQVTSISEISGTSNIVAFW